MVLKATEALQNEISGILNILKPPGMTSFDVVGFLRKVLRIKKIGHTGTLDPAATGVLPVCVGQATKAIEYMVEKDKVYRAELTLGAVTDTQDSTGTVLETREINVSLQQLYEAVSSFLGKYSQIPPMYSAVKIGGKKLYELAREGVTVEREAREVEIYSIKIINYKENEKNQIEKAIIDVHCSKGTYIRTLCADIGEKLGCGGHMSFLVRMKAGVFDISSAVTLQQIEDYHKKALLDNILIPVEQVFKNMSEIVLSKAEKSKFQNGVWVETGYEFSETEPLRVMDEDGRFLAVGEIFKRDGKLLLKSKKMFSR